MRFSQEAAPTNGGSDFSRDHRSAWRPDMPKEKPTKKEYRKALKETEQILSNPEWAEMIRSGKEEIKNGAPGKSLDELELED